MGIWYLINSTSEAVKQHAPIPTPIKQACKTSYGYCHSAGGEIVNAVRFSSERVSNYIPDQETQSQIRLFAYKFARNTAMYAIRESYKLVPGGRAFAEIFDETMRDVKSENQSKKGMEVGGGSGGKNSTSRNLVGRVELEVQSGGAELGRNKANQSPEDVLRNFMMMEFMGNRFADDLLLPQIKYVKKNQSEIKP